MNLPISYSKYSTFCFCPLKYIHQYVIKTESEFKIQYPLVLGQLTHLFIQLFNDEKFDKGDIINMKNDLDQLYDLIDLKYPSYYNGKYEIKQINIDKSISATIDFINENKMVFFHAVKLFNCYSSSFFPKINMSSDILSETTFHNIIPLNSAFTTCLYGSIDILFYNLIDDDLKYLYISDIKSGKKLYDNYFDQLYFYLYNLINYDTHRNKEIKNITDNIDVINVIKDKITEENSSLLLFSLQENITSKRIFSDFKDEYDKYIDKLFKTLQNDIYFLHKDKDYIDLDEMFSKYKTEYNLKDLAECKRVDVSYLCNFCNYIDSCEYRKLNT